MATTSGPGVTIGDHAWTVVDEDPAEGAAFIDDLQAQLVAVADRHTHSWRRGDVVVFDNRTVLHRREPGPVVRRRVLRRTIAWPRT